MIVVLVLAGVVIAALALLAGNLVDAPEIQAPPVSRAEGLAAQQKLFELSARHAGRSPRQESVVLTEREINSFLAHHLAQSARVPLDPIITRLTRGYFEIQGRTPLRNLLQAPPFAQVIPYLPATRLDTPVWITLRGTLTVEPATAGSARTVARLKFTDLAVGKQALPPSLLPNVLGKTASRVSEFPVPASVESVQIDDGRLILRTR